jgi:hypothetical protein
MSEDDERIYVTRLDGEYFGWIDDNSLFSKDGRHVGELAFNRHIYGKDGAYLGELRGDRLLTNSSRVGTNRKFGFLPSMRVLPPQVSPGRMPALSLPGGYEEFPESI